MERLAQIVAQQNHEQSNQEKRSSRKPSFMQNPVLAYTRTKNIQLNG